MGLVRNVISVLWTDRVLLWVKMFSKQKVQLIEGVWHVNKDVQRKRS